MSLVKAVLPYLPWLLPWAFVHFWVIDRVRAYFLLTEEEGLQGFVDAVLPANYSEKIVTGFRESAVHALYSDRTWNIRFHVGLGAVVGVLIWAQLLPVIRNRYIWLHRRLGLISMVLLPIFAAEIIYTMFIRGMVDMGPAIFWGDCVALAGLIVGLPLGYKSIKAHDISGHRFWMSFMAASCMINPVQRFFWPIFAKSEIFGHAETWQAFLDGPTKASIYATIVVAYGVWALSMYIYGRKATVKAV